MITDLEEGAILYAAVGWDAHALALLRGPPHQTKFEAVAIAQPAVSLLEAEVDQR